MEVDSQTIVVKLTYDGQMRRFPFEGTSFNALHEQIVQLLALGNGTDLVLKYTDEEGDLITISSDLELKSAVSPGNLLRISVLRKPSADSLGATPTPQEPDNVGDLDFTFKGLGFEQGCNPHGWGHARRHLSKEEWEMLKKHKKERKMFKHHEFGPYAHHGHGHHRGPRCFPPGPHGPHGPHGFPPGPPFGFPPGFGGFPHGGPHSPHGGPHGGPHSPHGGPHGGPHSPHGHHHERHGGRHGPHGNNEKADRLFARFAKDVTIEDGYLLAPNVPFVKTWRLRNEGSVAWPTGSVLRFVGKHSDNMGGPEFVPVEPISPGEEVDISVNLCSPSKPGRYTGYWRMCTADEKKFGQRVWVSIIVPADGTSSSESDKEADKLEALVDIVLANEQLRSLGIKRHKVYRLLKRCGGDIDKVMEIMNKKIAKRMKKMEKCKN